MKIPAEKNSLGSRDDNGLEDRGKAQMWALNPFFGRNAGPRRAIGRGV